MDWQSIVSFCLVFHLTSFVMDELRKFKAKAEMDNVLRVLRNINTQIDNQDGEHLRRIK